MSEKRMTKRERKEKYGKGYAGDPPHNDGMTRKQRRKHRGK